ncbi:hypothetical protein B0O99DRAFT_476865, partial [Bisporella sp. PMI_857]
LPTSAGKSLIYLLLAALNNAKTTIVIVPLIGLKSNLIQRASEFNIPCNTYENNPIFTNLTLISIETITSWQFNIDLIKLIDENKLDRIVFDEC